MTATNAGAGEARPGDPGDPEATRVSIRPAMPEDDHVLWRMLALAADWRPGSVPRPVSSLRSEPTLAHYVDGWGSTDDVGYIAEHTERAGPTEPVGAAWWRCFSTVDPGFGFVDDAVPEVSIGVLEPWRGRGVGTRLLLELVEAARARGLAALSLSVESDNPAATLYRRIGFVAVGRVDASLTMRLDLDHRGP